MDIPWKPWNMHGKCMENAPQGQISGPEIQFSREFPWTSFHGVHGIRLETTETKKLLKNCLEIVCVFGLRQIYTLETMES